jgi:hypothetical protein
MKIRTALLFIAVCALVCGQGLFPPAGASGNATTVNGGSVPASANVISTNGSSQPVAADAHKITVPFTCAAASASGTAYTCTTSPSFTPAANDRITFVADVASTGSATLAVNGATAATIKKQGGSANLVANDLLAAQRVVLIFDGTNWQMQGLLGNVPAGGGITTLTGDVTASGTGSVAATLANIPTNVIMAGSLLATAVAAPATPATGKGSVYVDSTSKNLAVKDDAGVVKHGVQTDTGTANNYISAIADNGAITKSRPSCATLSDSAGGCSMTFPTSAGVLGTNGSAQAIAASAHGLATPLLCTAASASGTAYTCTTSPTFAPASGDAIVFVADVANTGSATLNVNSSSAATIKKQGGNANLIANDLLIGTRSVLVFDGTNWQMQAQTGNAAAGGTAAPTFFLPFASCNAGSASPGWDIPASGGMVAACVTDGTNGTVQGVLQAADAQTAYYTVLLPTAWTTFTAAKLLLSTTDTTSTHTIIFNIAFACTAAGSVDTPAYNTATAFTTVTIAGGAVSGQVYSTSASSFTLTGCAAGKLAHARITRATDTSTDASVSLAGGLVLE